jgi:hypothetical protein
MNDIVVRLAAALGMDVRETEPMGQLDSFAEDVNETVASLNSVFEALNARKIKLRERGVEIAAKWAQHFDGQDAALAVAEAALNRISNVPLSTAVKTEPKEQTLSEVQKNG